MLDLLATVAETSNTVPVAAISSIVSAALGAVGAHLYKTARPLDPQVYVTRKEFDDQLSRINTIIIEGERNTQSRLDQVISGLGELKGIVSVITPNNKSE